MRIATELPQTSCAAGAPRRNGAESVERRRGSRAARSVSSTTDQGGVDHLEPRAVARLGGEERQERTQPLAARVDQVARRVVGQRVDVRDGVAQPLLDDLQPCGQALAEVGIGQREGRHRGHGTNLSARRPEAGTGNRPGPHLRSREERRHALDRLDDAPRARRPGRS